MNVVTETECVYCAVRTKTLYIVRVDSLSLKKHVESQFLAFHHEECCSIPDQSM
jgi:hypothetical protein